MMRAFAVLAALCCASPAWAGNDHFTICLPTEYTCVPACFGPLCRPDPAPWLWREWDDECQRYVCGPLEPVPPPMVDGEVCFWGSDWTATTGERCSPNPNPPERPGFRCVEWNTWTRECFEWTTAPAP